MSRLRVISVWVVAISALFIVYRVYNRISDTPVIQPPGTPSAYDLPEPVFGDGPSIAGTTQVGQAENARYTFVDEQTKKVTRVFGFEKLLNPESGSRRWNLQKPYISMYEKTFDCEITADRGALTVETIKGNPSPTEGKLYENVVIRIRAKEANGAEDSVVYMDELIYNSERSEFSTEGPVRLVSPRADMEGTGLLLVYNGAMNRIEFLKVVDLHYLKLKDIEQFSADANGESGSAAGGRAEAARPAGQVSAGGGGAAGPAKAAATVSPDDLYTCTFSRDVVIDYGGEVTVESAREVFIKNILMPRSDKHRDGDEASADAKKPAPQATDAIAAAADMPAASPGETAAVTNDAQTAAARVDVYVTCKGGFVAKPLTSVFEVVEPTLLRQRADSGIGEVRTPALSPAGASMAVAERGTAEASAVAAAEGEKVELAGVAHFKAARGITYDMATGHGLAEGPVELTFRPAEEDQDDPNAVVLPMVVAAEGNAEFLANADRVVEKIVFNKNVVGTHKVQTPGYMQTSTFYGEKLTTRLVTDRDSKRNGQIDDIAVTEGNVKLQSIRTTPEGTTTSNVVLVCVQVDYNAEKSVVYATGPGYIELNNENAPVRPSAGAERKFSLDGPCYARVRGFDMLTWFTEAMQINAVSRQEALHLAYQPISDGRLGQRIYGSTARLQANFWPLPDGGNELATVIAAGGIIYHEVGGNFFKGEDLLYDAEKGLLVVSSSERNDCLFNGALVDRIEYEVNTGRVRSNLASSPGAVTVPVQP